MRKSEGEREEWLDALRCFAILLVVIGHVLGLWRTDYKVIDRIYNGIYLFHMPLFFVMSGITFEMSAKGKICGASG